MENETFYSAYGQYTDKLETGFKLKIEHHVEYESYRIGRPEIAAQVKFSPAELEQKRKASAKLEQEIYDKMLGTVKEWEAQAAQTLLLDKALEYANTPDVPHTSNEWKQREDGSWEISNLPDLVALPMVDIIRLERESTEKEQAIYGKLLDVVKEWKEQAGQTVGLRQAKQYLLTPTTSHTANQWQAKEYGWHELSNMVYKFTWRVYERTAWNRKAGKSVTEAWELSWYLTFNTPQEPDFTGPGRQIAGQDRKVFKDPADMEKYLQGRIKAYAHLFTEISPPIPKEHKKRFCVNGVLLPGYTVDDPDALKPDEAALDDLLSLLDNEDIGGEAPSAPSAPQPEEKPPQAIWEKHRKQRTGSNQRKSAPVR